MPIDASLLDELHQIAKAVAPELYDGRNLHVLDGDEQGLPRADCRGWAVDGSVFDANLYDILGEVAPVVAIFPSAIESSARPGAFAQCCRTLLLHELAHVLPRIETLASYTPIMDNPRIRSYQRRHFLCDLARPVERFSDDPTHDIRFARRCCHVYSRAAAKGIDVPLSQLFSVPGRNHEAWYLNACLGETIRLQDAPFSEIEATPIPAPFAELWEADQQLIRQLYDQDECLNGERQKAKREIKK